MWPSIAPACSIYYPKIVSTFPSILQICRYGGAELHSVASFLGGAAAHECIKLLTSQFIPIDNLVVYNAVTANITSFKVGN